MNEPHFIHSSVDGHLGCFRTSAVVNSAVINICVQTFFWVSVFDSFGCTPRSGISGSYSSAMLNSLESESISYSVMSNSLQLQGLLPTRLLYPWNSPGKNTGVGSHFLLWGSPDPGSKSRSHALQILYRLSHWGSPGLIKEMPKVLPAWLHHFTLPLGMCEGSNFSTTSLTFDIFCFWY